MPEIFASQAHFPTSCVYAFKKSETDDFSTFMHVESNFFFSKTTFGIENVGFCLCFCSNFYFIKYSKNDYFKDKSNCNLKAYCIHKKKK